MSECVCQVAKMLGKKLFYGSVTEIWKGTMKFYHVVYDDGDESDLDFRECTRAVLLFISSKRMVEIIQQGVSNSRVGHAHSQYM